MSSHLYNLHDDRDYVSACGLCFPTAERRDTHELRCLRCDDINRSWLDD